MFRVVVVEMYRCNLRILAIKADLDLRYGPAVPADPRQRGQMSFRQESIFLFACSDDIKRLSREHPWMGPIDQQLAGEAFHAGAAWAFRTQDSCTSIDGKVFGQP